jgi:hypothetical protein
MCPCAGSDFPPHRGGEPGRDLRSIGRSVFLTIANDRAVGGLGAAPLALTVEPEDGGLHFNGLVEGSISDFHLGGERLRGKIGACSYELRRRGQSYEGVRSCGAMIEGASFDLPDSLATRGPLELGSVVGIFLSGGDVGGRLERLAAPRASFGAAHSSGGGHALPPTRVGATPTQHVAVKRHRG